MKENAVANGHTLTEFIMLFGTVSRSISLVVAKSLPERRAWAPKKYVLKTGGKKIWLMVILVATDRMTDE